MADKDLTQRGTENRAEGTVDHVKGRVKDAAGSLTGDREMEAEGKFDQVKGKVKDTLGKGQQELDRQINEPER